MFEDRIRRIPVDVFRALQWNGQLRNNDPWKNKKLDRAKSE